ncbi:MFS transporter [Derxia gummosa]|uniref:MFS transporter n=1 Tax=Derxia gummosa DSM 723 TaxID=1121388 RepID=A0A8B6X550_9BURK|nr:MFS transporter [Derxia gummosa]
MSAITPPATARGWYAAASYGALGLPLAFVALPLYLQLPHHYATVAGVPLGALGAVLLAARAGDALIDPWLGRLADRGFARGGSAAWRLAAAGALLLALVFPLLWWPPTGKAALAWLGLGLIACMPAASLVGLVHQAWGTRRGGTAAERATIAASREGFALAGVLCASALPLLGGPMATSVALALGLALGLAALTRSPAPVVMGDTAMPAPKRTPDPGPNATAGAAVPIITGLAADAPPSPWAIAAFRRLLGIHLLNGTAAAVPATLLPFFVADRLQLPGSQPFFLLAYFCAAALGLPLWLRLVPHIGLARAWRLGMVASVLAFAATLMLGSGDGRGFTAICLASGLALGADLALPAALLTGVIRDAGLGQRGEGACLGWWACASKLNLALAAGLALPLLDLAGYQAGSRAPAALQSLAIAYGLLPCLLKLAAAGWLLRAERHHPRWSQSA